MDLIQQYLKGECTEVQKDELINILLKGINQTLTLARQIEKCNQHSRSLIDGGARYGK